MSDMLALPRAGQYGCILADPPWAFKTFGGKTGTPHRGAHDHYGTVATVALGDLPVKSIAAKDCALFMWVVDSHLEESMVLGKAWGFEFKTVAFVWQKMMPSGRPAVGMGYWTRKQAEVCLLFVKGKPRRLDKGVRQTINAPRREHSRKPEAQYERIERLVGGPYVELFARQSPRPTWDAWGNEVGKLGAAYVAPVEATDAGKASAGSEAQPKRVGEPPSSSLPPSQETV